MQAIDSAFAGIFGEGWETFKNTLNELSPILAGIGAALLTIKIGLGIGGLIETVATKFSGLFTVLATHPFLIIAAAIAGVATALVKLYNENEDFRRKVNTAWQLLKTSASLAWTAIKTSVETAFTAMQTAWEAVSGFFTTTIPEAWEGLKTAAETSWNGIKTAIQVAINSAKTSLTNTWNSISTYANTIWNAALTVATSTWNNIKSAIETPINTAKDTLASVWNSIKSTAETLWGQIKTKAEELWNNIKDAIMSPINSAVEAVESTWGDFMRFLGVWPPEVKEGFEDNITKPAETATGKVLTLKEAIKALDGTSSTSQIITEYITKGDPGNSAANLQRHSYNGGGGTSPTLTLKNPNPIARARSMFGGSILQGATLFGWDAQGRPQIGGGEGPEAVVGVGSLKEQIRDAVREGFSGIGQSLAAAVGGENQQPIYVVLDTGALVGAIGGEMDAELARYGNWAAGGGA